MKGFSLKVAIPQDHKMLTELAIESKRYWNYPEEWIRGWMPELTITPGYIQTHHVYKLTKDPGDHIIGFCALEWEPEKLELEIAHLWLKPAYIGKDLGRFLLDSSLNKVKALPVKSVKVISDPNAIGFYQKYGFLITEQVESTPPGRTLPCLVLEMT